MCVFLSSTSFAFTKERIVGMNYICLFLFVFFSSLSSAQALRNGPAGGEYASFLHAGRPPLRTVRQAARAAVRQPEAYHLYQRPQQRGWQQQIVQERRPQHRREVRHAPRPQSPVPAAAAAAPAPAQQQQLQKLLKGRSGVPAALRHPQVTPALAQPESVLSALAAAPQPAEEGQKKFGEPAAVAEGARGGEAASVTSRTATRAAVEAKGAGRATTARGLQTVMRELGNAATRISAATSILSSEGELSLRALNHLSIPDLSRQPPQLSAPLSIAEVVSVSDEGEVHLKKVPLVLKRFVHLSPFAAVFEVAPVKPPFSTLHAGLLHLRVGWSSSSISSASASGQKTKDTLNPLKALLAAAAVGEQHVQRSLRLMHRLQQKHVVQLSAASSVAATAASSALLLPLFAAQISVFRMPFAWSGPFVFSSHASLTPPYASTLGDMFNSSSHTLDPDPDRQAIPRPRSIPAELNASEAAPVAAPAAAPAFAPDALAAVPARPSREAASLQKASAAVHAYEAAATDSGVHVVEQLSGAAREYAALRVLRAVSVLHAAAVSAGYLSLASVAVSAQGEVYLTNLEMTETEGDLVPCEEVAASRLSPAPHSVSSSVSSSVAPAVSPAFSPQVSNLVQSPVSPSVPSSVTPVSSSVSSSLLSESSPSGLHEASRFFRGVASPTFAAPGEEEGTEALAGAAAAAAQEAPGPAAALCPLHAADIRVRIGREGFLLPFLLLQILSNGINPFNLPKRLAPAEAFTVLQQQLQQQQQQQQLQPLRLQLQQQQPLQQLQQEQQLQQQQQLMQQQYLHHQHLQHQRLQHQQLQKLPHQHEQEQLQEQLQRQPNEQDEQEQQHAQELLQFPVAQQKPQEQKQMQQHQQQLQHLLQPPAAPLPPQQQHQQQHLQQQHLQQQQQHAFCQFARMSPSAVASELNNMEISEKWVACLLSLWGCYGTRLSVPDAAALYFPELQVQETEPNLGSRV